MHPLSLRLDHVSLFPNFHETSGTLTEISSTVDIYILVFGDTVRVVLKKYTSAARQAVRGNIN